MISLSRIHSGWHLVAPKRKREENILIPTLGQTTNYQEPDKNMAVGVRKQVLHYLQTLT